MNRRNFCDLGIREWLANQAAGGYLTYEPSSHKCARPFEHAQALVNENSWEMAHRQAKNSKLQLPSL